MATVPVESLKELLTCAICMETKGTQKQLPCQHTVCETCVGGLVQTTKNAHGQWRRAHNRSINCPMCRRQVFIPEGDPSKLPTNYAFVQLHELITRTSSGTIATVCQLCVQEEKNVADNFCKDCNVLACLACSAMHNSGLFADHRIVDASLVYCRAHSKTYRNVCFTCNKFLCISCLSNGSCTDHDVKAFQHIEASTMKEMTEIIDRLEFIKQQIQGRQRHVEVRKGIKHKLEKLQATRAKLDTHIHGLLEKVKRNGQLLLRDIEKQEEKMQQLEKRLEEEENLLADIEALKVSAENAREKGVEETLVEMPKIKDKMPLTTRPMGIPLLHLSSFDTDKEFCPAYSVDVGKLCRSPDTVLPRFTVKLPPGQSPTSAARLSLPRLLWEQENAQEGIDLTFTSSGDIAVTASKTIFLYASDGSTKASYDMEDSEESHFCGIAAYHPENALVVTDFNFAGFRLLEGETLQPIRNVPVAGVKQPYAVAVLSDDHLVLKHDNCLSICDIDGRVHNRWLLEVDQISRFENFKHLDVDDKDRIFVTCNEAICVFERQGTCPYRFRVTQPQIICWDSTRRAMLVIERPASEDDGHRLVRLVDIDRRHKEESIKWEEEDMGQLQSMTILDFIFAVLDSKGLHVYEI